MTGSLSGVADHRRRQAVEGTMKRPRRLAGEAAEVADHVRLVEVAGVDRCCQPRRLGVFLQRVEQHPKTKNGREQARRHAGDSAKAPRELAWTEARSFVQ